MWEAKPFADPFKGLLSTMATDKEHSEATHFKRLSIDATHYEVARDWVGRFVTPLRTLDALHLAVCFASDAALLTADVGLAKAAHHFRIPTKLLEQAEA